MDTEDNNEGITFRHDWKKKNLRRHAKELFDILNLANLDLFSIDELLDITRNIYKISQIIQDRDKEVIDKYLYFCGI